MTCTGHECATSRISLGCPLLLPILLYGTYDSVVLRVIFSKHRDTITVEQTYRENKSQMTRSWSVVSLAIVFPCGFSLSVTPSPINCGASRRILLGHAVQTCFIGRQTSAWANEPSAPERVPYSATWTGTVLQLLDVETAGQQSAWIMGRWPDPILRRPAEGVEERWFGTQTLKRVTELLSETARVNNAVGLAAQQCGVNARVVILEKPKQIIMVNPHIVGRSEERNMKVWQECCLVLPPTFTATVLRDTWVEIEYWNWKGHNCFVRLKEEAARAAEHELDHDRGILILDHVGLEEMETDAMRSIEWEGHSERMTLAYSRSVELKFVQSKPQQLPVII